jgi:putative phage-type endonuclease
VNPLDFSSVRSQEEWLKWRQAGFGSSESAALIGANPWTTLLDLYLQKTGHAIPFVGSAATREGHRKEPLARAEYEARTGLLFPPAWRVHPEYDFIRASADGWNEKTRTLLEIKSPTKPYEEGTIPKYYLPQCVHLAMTFEAERVIFIHYYPDRITYTVEVRRNPKMEAKIIEKAAYVWEHIQAGTVPGDELISSWWSAS